MNKILYIVGIIIGLIGVFAIFGLLLAFPIMWCWNYTMPYLFNLNEITWGQAWCLLFLAACLIKSTQTNSNK